MQQLSKSNVRDKIKEIRQQPTKELKAFEKRDKITQTIIGDLKSNGVFFNSERGEFYFKQTSPATLHPLNCDSLPLAAFIQQRFGLNRAETREYEHVLSGLQIEAFTNGRRVDIHQLAHYDSRKGLMYVSRFNGEMYRMDGCKLESITNGTDGVFFWDDPRWEPYAIKAIPQNPNRLDNLVLKSPNLVPSHGLSADDQRWLFKVWMFAQFFGSLQPTKPLFLICGPKGGGKTATLRKWLRLLFGGKAEVTALEQGKPDGFVAKITSAPIAVFDNVDERIKWLPNQLAQLATGLSFSRRVLYTTNDQVELIPDCWVGLTSRNPDFVESRDDLPDRMIILQTDRFPSFTPEGALLAELASKRDDLWTEILQTLNRLVAFFRARGDRTPNLRFRMADFASFALKFAECEGKRARAIEIFNRMERRQAEFLLEADPIRLCLEEWLKAAENHGREVNSAALRNDLGTIAERLKLEWQYPNPQSLGQRLPHVLSGLQQCFDVTTRKDSSNVCWYQFRPKAESLNPVESPPEEIQGVSPAVLAAASMSPESLNHF
jgi:hypothetical protein